MSQFVEVARKCQYDNMNFPVKQTSLESKLCMCPPLHALCDVGEGPEHLRQLGRVELGWRHLLLILILASTATVLVVVKLKT